MKKTFVLIVGLCVLSACSSKKVRELYHPSQKNLFETECTTEQGCFQQAREHCNSDFEVIKKGSKESEKDGEVLETLQFRCI